MINDDAREPAESAEPAGRLSRWPIAVAAAAALAAAAVAVVVVRADPVPIDPVAIAAPTGATATTSPATASLGPRSPRTGSGLSLPADLAIDRRGCGWFVAYDPGVVVALDQALAGQSSDPGREVLNLAVRGDVDRLGAALSAGAPADLVVPGFDYTPLTAAVSSRCTQAVDALLAAGADPDLVPPGAEPPIVVAAGLGDAPVVALLVAAGAKQQAKGPLQLTAREVALALGDDLVLAELDQS